VPFIEDPVPDGGGHPTPHLLVPEERVDSVRDQNRVYEALQLGRRIRNERFGLVRREADPFRDAEVAKQRIYAS
jgi:hypothetical protein